MAQNSREAAKRRGCGRPFPPGVSGNPGGRPAKTAEVRALARLHTGEAIRTLVRLMRSGKPDRTRAAAAEAILDRAWGRPVQAIEPRNALGALPSSEDFIVIEVRDGGAGHYSLGNASPPT